MTFDQFGLAPKILRALERLGYKTPTPIQEKTIPPGLAGKDVLGIAQTGTGKTAAFALPTLQRLDAAPAKHNGIRALILTPTRELAAQVADAFEDYGHFLDVDIFEIHGGVSERPQIAALRRGIDVLVATPGRLLDLMEQGHVRLSHVEVLILDEADRMLDMGFMPDVRRIVKQVPAQRQTMLFSATLPAEIRNLARGLLHDPEEVSVAAVSAAADTIQQCVYHVAGDRKQDLLRDLLARPEVTRALVFARTKRRADRVVKSLNASGMPAEAIHGNKSQGARTRALANFGDGTTRVLVASDLASRGIDIDMVSHVFNFDLPNEPEVYVHRIGRTGRAGASGLAVSFCAQDERVYLRDIEKLIGKSVPVARLDGVAPAPRLAPVEPPAPRAEPSRAQQRRQQAGGGRPAPRRDRPQQGQGGPGGGRKRSPRRKPGGPRPDGGQAASARTAAPRPHGTQGHGGHGRQTHDAPEPRHAPSRPAAHSGPSRPAPSSSGQSAQGGGNGGGRRRRRRR